MSVFTDNIKNNLPTKVVVEQSVHEGILNIADRVNNDFGKCRPVFSTYKGTNNDIYYGGLCTLNTFETLLHEIHEDISEHKVKLKPGIGIAMCDVKTAKVKSTDPEKAGFNIDFDVVYYNKETDEKLIFSTNLDVYIYIQPHWKPKHFPK